MALKLIDKYARGFVHEHELSCMQPQITAAHELLHSGTGAGNDFIGWLDLPKNYDKEEFSRIKAAAGKIKLTKEKQVPRAAAGGEREETQ